MRLSRLAGGLAAAILATAAAAQPADPPALARWSDDIVGRAVAEGRLSGAAVAIVEHGKVVFARGYGHDGTVAVSPDATPFSIGSITKSFTATAIAQLLESGRIRSLDDPANRYLKRVQLPRYGGRDIRVRDLLAHRAGFDDSVFGLATPVAVPIPLPHATIERRLPPLVRTPGSVSVYSNIGYGVLGLLIEDVTGETYPAYIQRHILAPLGMTRSFVRTGPAQPIAVPLTSHPGKASEAIPQNWAYHPFILPSAGIVSTASDMARMAAAQMAAERASVPGITGPEMARRMHRTLAGNAPGVSSFGFSFILTDWNGSRVIENEGSGPGFQANFILLPDRDTALVTVMMGNRERGEGLNMFSVRRSFLDRMLGPWRPRPEAGALLDVQRLAGLYRAARRPSTSVETVLNPGEMIDVRAAADGTLTINGRSGYRQFARGRFWRAGVTPYVPDASASDVYAFVTDGSGRVRYVATHLAVEIFEPVRVSPGQMEGLGGGGLAGALLGLAALFWRPRLRPQCRARWLAVTLAGSAGLFAATLFGGPMVFGDPMLTWAFADRQLFLSLIVAAHLVLLATVALAVAVVRLWFAEARPPLLWHACLGIATAGGAAASAAFFYFNLLGSHLR